MIVVSVKVAHDEHVGIHHPYHDVVDGPMHLTETYAVITGMYEVLYKDVFVYPCPIGKDENWVVWWRCKMLLARVVCSQE